MSSKREGGNIRFQNADIEEREVDHSDDDVPRCGPDGIAHWKGMRLVAAGYFQAGRDPKYKFVLKGFLKRHPEVRAVVSNGITQTRTGTPLYNLDQIRTLYDQETKGKPRCGPDGIAHWKGMRLVTSSYFDRGYDPKYKFGLNNFLQRHPKIKPVVTDGIDKKGSLGTPLFNLDVIKDLYDQETKDKPRCGPDGIAHWKGMRLVSASYFSSGHDPKYKFDFGSFSRRNPRVKPVVNDGIDQNGVGGKALFNLDVIKDLYDQETKEKPRCGPDGIAHWKGMRLVAAGYFQAGRDPKYRFHLENFLKRNPLIKPVVTDGVSRTTLNVPLYDLDQIKDRYDQETKGKPRCGPDGIAHWKGMRLVTSSYFDRGYDPKYKFGLNNFLQRHPKIKPVVTDGIDKKGSPGTPLFNLDVIKDLYDQETKDKPRCGPDGIAHWRGMRLVTSSYFTSGRDPSYQFSLVTFLKRHPKVKPIVVESIDQQGKPSGHLYNLDVIKNLYDQETKEKPHCGPDHIAHWNNMRLVSTVYFTIGRDPKYRFDFSSFLKRNPTVKPVVKDGINYNGRRGVHLYDLDVIKSLYDAERGRVTATAEAEEVLNETLSDPSSESGKNFYTAVQILGASALVVQDILHAQHPEIKALPPEDVRGAIGELLGEFAYTRPPLKAESVSVILPLLKIPSLRERFAVTVEESVLRAILQRKNKKQTELACALDEIRKLSTACAKIMTPELRMVFDDVRAYYVRVCGDAYELPRVRSELKPGRPFPDMYQRINIEALERKKRLLIADEMGSGKSASAILAKEKLCPKKPALLLVPSAVVETWKGYLLGNAELDVQSYFKDGKKPKVLVLENAHDVKRLKDERFDYVICSHERLSRKEYFELSHVQFGMVAIDEVHKLKNVHSGKQAKHALQIVEHIADRDGYVALLSGTPIPNTVRDIAVLHKMLHPDQFRDVTPASLARMAIRGDMLEQRALLVPSMQRKNLRDHVELPPITEVTVPVHLSAEEEQMYELLLENDEMTAIEKIHTLQQAVLNPKMLGFSTRIEGSKKRVLHERLNAALEQKDTVIVFVNDYVHNILRGEHAIIDKNMLPEGVAIDVVDGKTNDAERLRIQHDMADKSQKRVIFVSGQTAGVGVDYSRADHVIFYNEPWTLGEKHQQLARVARPGLSQPLTVETLITEGTIEHGKHLYAALKHRVIEKLLNGIAISELEKKIAQTDTYAHGTEKEVNPEFAKFYLSEMQRMVRLFGNARELGTKEFSEWVQKNGEVYANTYVLSGRRNYHANVARINNAVLKRLMIQAKQSPEDVSILDAGSGPEMLRQFAPEEVQDCIVSTDAIEDHFQHAAGKTIVLNFTDLSKHVAPESMDYVNCSLALNYTRYLPLKDEMDRVDTLCEINKVLKVGGRAVITLPYSFHFKDIEALGGAVTALGFSLDRSASGYANAGSVCRAQVVTLEKKEHVPQDVARANMQELEPRQRNSLKMKSDNSHLINQREIIHSFTLAGTSYSIDHNDKDMMAVAEEAEVYADIQAMIGVHKRISKIPVAVLEREGFSRMNITQRKGVRSILFKQLRSGGVIVKGQNINSV